MSLFELSTIKEVPSPVLIVTFALLWCCAYGVFYAGVSIRLKKLLRTNPSEYPSGLLQKTGDLANLGTSTLNSLVGILALITYCHVSHSNDTLIKGPMNPIFGWFYINFIAYFAYDIVYELFLTENEKLNIPILFHHVIYMFITCLLYKLETVVYLALCLLLQEFSTPFINAVHAMKHFKMESSRMFTLVAVLGTIAFGLFRALLPLYGFYYVFSHWGILSQGTPRSGSDIRMTLGCVLLAVLGYVLQLFWFYKICKGLVKHMIGKKVKLMEQREDENESSEEVDDDDDIFTVTGSSNLSKESVDVVDDLKMNRRRLIGKSGPGDAAAGNIKNNN